MAADFGISIADKLVETIGSTVINEVGEMLGYKSQIDDLKQTVLTIRQVLLCAEARRELNEVEQDYIEKLKDAVYDADDLFDEFHTLAEFDQLTPLSKPGKLLEILQRFFSCKNQVGKAYKMSRQVKEIKQKLDAISDDHNKFGFSVDYKPISRRREETCSYVEAKNIIGREKDKDAIINMLLHQNADEEFCCVTIVGVGGLGKTALAQLVFNDEKVKKAFPDFRLWVCVSDQDGTEFDVKAILIKILELVTDDKFNKDSALEKVQAKFQERVGGRKYLIFLDDVWNEDHRKWLNLKSFLMMGQAASRIVVTTRSEMTGTVIAKKNIYELKGLSSENAWLLFESTAFHNEHKHENHDEFVELGRKIVEKCYNIPLAVKVVGSLLFCQDISKWQSINEIGLANIDKGKNEVLSILKLSYHNLAPSLKNCFSYCALFPKDYELNKETLISLWMAQGYIIPWDRGQSIEDAAEEHFVILLRRCFLQDVVKDDSGDICFVKIHDLMHDVAHEVGEKERQVVTSATNKFGDKVRHVRQAGDSFRKSLLRRSKIRSFLIKGIHEGRFIVPKIHRWECLRVLVVSDSGLVNLPNSIGNLIHLRYLDMSLNRGLELLPDAITRLHNLQTLLLYWCPNLSELPKDFCKLGKLRHLDLSDCYNLRCMPSGMENLTSLKILPWFVVGKKVSSEAQRDDELKPLKAFTGIRRDIQIRFGEYYRKVEGMDDMGGGYLKGMKHLAKVVINFDFMHTIWDKQEYERVMETLEPHWDVKVLKIRGYHGAMIPHWGRSVDDWAIRFSHLADIRLWQCRNLQEIPVLSKLPYLKKLGLRDLDIEYMETSSDSQAAKMEMFFPSLVQLVISELRKLEGWWKGVEDDHHLNTTTLIFPCLSHLEIKGCPRLTSFPPCPRLEYLELHRANEALQMKVKTVDKEDDNNTANSQITANLRCLNIDNLSHLKSLPINCLTDLYIFGDQKADRISRHHCSYGDEEDKEGESLETVESVSQDFHRCSSFLQHLFLHNVDNLGRLCGRSGLEHFTSLETLEFSGVIPRFSINDEDGDSSLFWKSIPQNLHTLELTDLGEETSLPNEMKCLTSLSNLEINWCYKFEALPDWIDCLSSLQSLTIKQCPSLKSLPQSMQNLTSLQRLHISAYQSRDLIKRCKEPNGEDYPKIRHIPNIDLSSEW